LFPKVSEALIFCFFFIKEKERIVNLSKDLINKPIPEPSGIFFPHFEQKSDHKKRGQSVKKRSSRPF
tara:strand:- start:122 stop:322 length:201 start_codon:yes stop_codon:yes gene_type:complete